MIRLIPPRASWTTIASGMVAFVIPTAVTAQVEDSASLAKRAQDVFQTFCYRCHGQNGSNEGGINFIIDLRRLAERKKVVVPGNPDKSKLYERITSADEPMPPKLDEGDAKREPLPRPSREDIAAVEQWIKAGAPNLPLVAAKTPFISDDELVRSITDDLRSIDTRHRRFIRYFTITHLSNAGLGEDQLQTLRHGLSKLANSLSWGRRIVVPTAIDPGKTVLRIDLRDFKWDSTVWEAILARYPYGVTRDDAAAKGVYEATGCALPYVRADWFVFAASKPPLYHDVLQLPKTDRELERKLDVDVEGDIKAERIDRAGFNGSGVSRNNRIIERHESSFGAYWRSYDFAGNTGRRNILAHPLGPGDGDAFFLHDGGEIIFTLPNGLQAYMLVLGNGGRIDKGPTNIVLDKAQADSSVVNGISCMRCHYKGIIEKADQIRKLSQNEAVFPPATGEAIRSLYPPPARFDNLLKEDAERFARSVSAAGAPLSQTEPVFALAKQFENDLDLDQAAAESGLTPQDFLALLGRSSRLAQALGLLFNSGGTVNRDLFDETFPVIIAERKLGLRPHAKPGSTIPGLALIEQGRLRDAIEELDGLLRSGPSSPALASRALAHFFLNDLDSALGDAGAAIALDSKNPLAFLARGLVFHERSNYDRAITDFTDSLRLRPGSPAAWGFRARSRVATHGENSYSEARNDAGRALQLQAGDVLDRLSLGNAKIVLDQREEAIRDFDQVLKVGPNALAYASRGVGRTAAGKYDEALADLDEAIRLRPNDADSLMLRGGIYRHKKRYDLALRDMDDALRLKPSEFGYHLTRGRFHRERGETEKALADFEEEVKINGHRFSARTFLIDALRKKGDFERALKVVTEQLGRDPKGTNSLYSERVAILIEAGQLDRALADCDEWARIDPTNAYALLDRADVFELKRQFSRALADYDEALRIGKPPVPVLWFSYGKRAGYFHRRGQLDRAIADYTEAIRLVPSSEHLARRAVVLIQAGRLDEAIADSDKAIETLTRDAVRVAKDPGFASLVNVYERQKADSYINRGAAYKGKGQLDRALADFDEAIRREPKNATFFAHRADAYNSLAQSDKAIADCDEAIQLDPKNMSAFSMRAVAFEKKGDFTRAESDRQKAAQLGAKKP
jgi:tetratricopeptide (TPR) repeat protein